MKRSLLSILLLIIGIIYSGTSQVSAVKYLIEYNEETSLYDCKIVITEGEATTILQRIQFNSLFNIVVPTGAQVEIQQRHNPLENNQFYSGTIPCHWEISNPEIAPPAQPENDFYSFFTYLSPVSAYNNLIEGDTVNLFSVFIDVDPCEHFVRPFINGSDPSSLDMPSGADYNNGFSIGSGEQIYNGNMLLNCPKICKGECVELTPSLMCSEDNFTFAWSTGEITPTITVCPDDNTTYTLEITNPNMEVLTLSSEVLLNDPIVETPNTDLCLGATMNLSPAFGGTWATSDPTVAVINAFTGLLTTISPGTVECTFTSAQTGCVGISETITVHDDPFSEVDDPIQLCVGETSILYPSLVGTWTSDNPNAISVDFDSGLITALEGGTALLSFTPDDTTCSSQLAVIAHDRPMGSIGNDKICLGELTSVSPYTGGSWVSDNIAIATVDNLGNVTPISVGSAKLSFTNSATGCTSEPLSLTVFDVPEVSLEGIDFICPNSQISASSSTTGVWTSSNQVVASIDNAGNITPISTGLVSFTFSDGQCSATTKEIQVIESISINIDTTICEGMDYNGLTESGIYTMDSVDETTGCDIITTIDLEVLPLGDPTCTVGIDDLVETEIKVYPNPTSDIIIIEGKSEIESVTIYTIGYSKIGDERFSSGSSKVRLSMDHLNQGLYILVIKSNGKLTYKKLIIE